MSTPDRYRDRKFCAVLYPEDPTHAEAIEKLKSGGYNFAAILHNEDIYEDGEHKGEKKKPHWHVVVKFPNAVWDTKLAKDLGIERNYLEKCKNLDAALLYLVHYGYEDTKYQYDVSEVFGPLHMKLVSLLNDTDESTRAMNLYQMIDEINGPVSYTEIYIKACKAGMFSDFRRIGSGIGFLIREHNEAYEIKQRPLYDPYEPQKVRNFMNIQPLERDEYGMLPGGNL